jgi:general stress protein YciG
MTAKKKSTPLSKAAAALGSAGGRARSAKLSPARRREIARIAGRARSKKLSKEERSRIAALGGKASLGKPKHKTEKKK